MFITKKAFEKEIENARCEERAKCDSQRVADDQNRWLYDRMERLERRLERVELIADKYDKVRNVVNCDAVGRIL